MPIEREHSKQMAVIKGTFQYRLQDVIVSLRKMIDIICLLKHCCWIACFLFLFLVCPSYPKDHHHHSPLSVESNSFDG